MQAVRQLEERPVRNAIIGIAAGSATGAVAILWLEPDGTVGGVEVHDLPTVKVGKRTRPNEVECADLLDLGLDDISAYVGMEQTGSRPGQGVASCYSLGYGAGLFAGIVSGKGWSWEFVRPQAWKAAMMKGIGDKSKDAARLCAQKMFPGMVDSLKRKKDHHRAEALLIAEYTRRRIQ